MRSTCNRSLWIILLLISIQCVSLAKQEFLKVQQRENQVIVQKLKRPADIASQWSIEQRKLLLQNEIHSKENVLPSKDDNKRIKNSIQQQQEQEQEEEQQQQRQRQKNTTECAKSSLETNKNTKNLEILQISQILNPVKDMTTNTSTLSTSPFSTSTITPTFPLSSSSTLNVPFYLYTKNVSQLKNSVPAVSKIVGKEEQKQLLEKSLTIDGEFYSSPNIKSIVNKKKSRKNNNNNNKRGKLEATKNRKVLHVAYTNRHKMLRDRLSRKTYNKKCVHKRLKESFKHHHTKRETVKKNNIALNIKNNRDILFSKQTIKQLNADKAFKPSSIIQQSNKRNQPYNGFNNESNSAYTSTLDIWSMPFVWSPDLKSRTDASLSTEELQKPKEPIIIIDDVEEFDSGTMNKIPNMSRVNNRSEDYTHVDQHLEPRAFPLRPLIPSPFDNEEISVVYADQHTEIRLMCEVDLDIASSTWYKNGQVVHAIDRTSRATDYRFIKEPNGALTITNVMLEDDGKWQCEAENTRRYSENARPVKLVVLDPPKAPYLLIDSRRLDAGNIFVPVKETSELNLTCISEGGNPKPNLSWEVLLSPGVDRHTQKVSAEVLELQEIKPEKEAVGQKSNSGTKSEARLPAVYRAHHNARILCVMEHPTLKVRQNASLLLDVQYTPSFAISRTPGFGYPLREGMEVSLKCDVDSNPPSTPQWQKDDNETPVPQNGDGFLNFTSLRREHSGWYKCTSRHLNFQYSSIGYYLSVRFDSVEVTSEPDDQDVSVAAASHNPNKGGQLEVQLGGTVTLQCPQGSLGCWSHLDPVTARLRGLGQGLSTPTGQFSIKDVVYQDAGIYKCVGQSSTNKKKFEVLQTVGVAVKGAPTVMARDAAPVAYPGSPLHLAVEFCANPPAHAARWLHGDRVFTPGNQYGSSVLAYGVMDLPTPFCKEARLTYVSMHERVERVFYFIVSTPGGVAEAMFKVNFTKRFRKLSNSNSVDDEQEKLSEPEEIHFPVFGVKSMATTLISKEALYWNLTFILFAKLVSFLKI